MALVLANRVQESATANTTVSFTLTGAVLGFQTFAVIGDTNTTFYSATDTAGNWEVGLGTYSSTGPTLTRDTIYASSNSGSAVTFPGAVNVFVTYPSGKSVNLDASNNVSALGTIASGTWQGTVIGVTYGGTGVTASSGANSVVLRDADQNISVNSVTQARAVVTSTGGTTTLTAASPHFQILIGTNTQTFQLPDATLLSTGTAWIFDNDSTQDLTVVNNASGPIDVVPPGGYATVFLESNSTVAGIWGRFGMMPGEVNWGTNSLNLGGSTVVTNGYWEGFAVQPAYGGTGLTTFVGANNALYSTGATTLSAGTLPAAAGGTGLTSFTANGIVYASSTSALATSSALVFDGTNVGVGATPAAWGSGWVALQFGLGGGVVGRTGNNSVYVTANTYFDGADYRYINNGFANYSRLFDGNYFFYSAASGTAGDVASFNSILEVEQDGTLRVPRGQIEVAATNGTSKGAIAPIVVDASNGGLSFKTEVAGVLTEQMTLSSDGNLVVNGTASASTAAAKTATTVLATTAFVDRLRSLLAQSTPGTGGTLVIGDRGTLVSVTAGVTVPASVFAANDVVTIYNNSAANITVTQGAGFTLRLVGTATTGNRTLAQRGLATVVFVSATEAVISGGGLT